MHSPSLTPRPYQIAGRDFLAARRCALLADEMRVGKTPQAILAAHKIGAERVVVICPAIARPQWDAEFRRWWPGAILPKLHILSYQQATTVWQKGLEGATDVLIADECHFAKNPEAQRTKMLYGKDGFAWHAGHVWALSGTPAPKHAAELWPMLKAFGVVKCTYGEFVEHYCVVDRFTERIVGTKAKHIPELRAMLSTIMLRRMRKDVASELPPIGYSFMSVLPTDKKDLQNVPEDGRILEWIESNPDPEDRVAVALAKVEPLAEHITFSLENALLRQTVVFGWHREPLQSLVDNLTARGVGARVLMGGQGEATRQETQALFRSGEVDVVCAQILAAGTAIDLSAASHGYFLELDWVPGNNVQAANRLVSMTKAEPVTFDVVTWPGSADDRVQRVLLRRTREISQLMETK